MGHLSGVQDRHRILVVDDDGPTRTLLRRLLAVEGYSVSEAADGPAALAQTAATVPDLALVDVIMPGQDGLDVMAELRRAADVPVILLSGRAAEADRVLGLRLGADDYVVKPFSTADLMARIAAVLRRAGRSRPAEALEFAGLHINRASHEVTVNCRIVTVPTREFELLVFLLSCPRQVFSREQLLAHVWQSSAERQAPATVTEHIRRLRHRIEDDPEHPRWLCTVRGSGYRFDPPPTPTFTMDE